MTEAEILPIQEAICVDLFGRPSVTLTAAAAAEDVPGWDSLNHVTLVVEMKRQFGIKFGTMETESFKNTGDRTRLIQPKSKKPN